jgi:plastocyanin
MLAATFNPTSLSVPKSTVVSFTNDSGINHNVVFDAPVAPAVTDIGPIASGTVTRTFSDSGTWKFHCTIHGGMNGQIVVP